MAFVPYAPPNDSIEELFTYHAPEGDDPKRYDRIRAAAKTFACIVLVNCPAGPDRAFAIRQIREAVMFANASIATRNAMGRFLDEEVRLERLSPGNDLPPDVEG